MDRVPTPQGAVLMSLPGDDLPDDALALRTFRWSPERKNELLLRIEHKRMSLNTAIARYGLTLEEIDEWAALKRAAGRPSAKRVRPVAERPAVQAKLL
jgi:hypothetical protein